MSTLKHLILYSDLRLGWFPKLDLRKIYFSKLQSLTLGHFVFTHEWQFEWILSHRATLRSLYLDHCSILYQAGFTIAGWLDEENYPQPDLSGDFGISGDLWPPDDEMKAAMTFVSYKVRWHDFFLSCADELCQLEDFRFGSSKQWNFNTRSRYPDDTDEPLPIMPWEAERKLENEIYEDAYVHYNDWKECYKAGDWEYKGNEDWKPEWQARMESPPDCKDEDEAALKLLLYKVGLKTGKVKT
jgi:hypothetical protein